MRIGRLNEPEVFASGAQYSAEKDDHDAAKLGDSKENALKRGD